MTQLHLQEMAKFENQPARRGLVMRALKALYLPVIAILITMVLAVGFKTAYGHRLEDQARASAATEQRQTREFSLTSIRSRVNHTKGLSLKSIRNRGGDIAIEGMAVSPKALAEMISSLQSTQYFSNIEVKETYQDDGRNKSKAFKFELTCEVDRSQS